MGIPTTRRDFLKVTAITGAALWLPGFASAQDAAQPSKRRFLKADKGGLLGRDEEEIAARLLRYQAAGFDGLEADAPGLNIDAVNAAVKKTGVPVHGVVDNVHWQKRLSDPDPAVRQEGLQALIQAIEECKQIGGTTVLLVPGRVTGPEETHEDVWKRSIVEIRKALPTAEKNQIKILIENVWNGFCETPEEYRDYIDEIDSEWVGAYFDIGNVRKFGKPEDWIRILGNRIVKLDVKDWGQENSFCKLGEGDVDWDAVHEALIEIDYSGWATREGKEDGSIEETSRLMNELLNIQQMS